MTNILMFIVRGKRVGDLALPFCNPTHAFNFSGKGTEMIATQTMFLIFRASALFLLLLVGLTIPALRAQESLNVDLIGQLPIDTEIGDIWVYNNVAYLARFGGSGVSIVDVSDPSNPVELTVYSSPATSGTWDVKAAKGLAFLAPQYSGVGLVILDVQDPSSPVLLSEFSHARVTSVHNIWADTTTNHLYLASNTTSAVEIVDVSNPSSPQHVGSFAANSGDIHDMVVIDGIMYASFLDGGLYLVDVSDPTDPQLMGFVDYPGAFTHNAWPSKDGSYVFTTDEVNGGHMRVFDVRDLQNIEEVASYQAGPPNAIIHNVVVDGDFVHIAYYSEGYRVVDVTDPENPVEAGFFDTYEGSSGGFDGAWGVYPFSEFIYVADIQSGLFVFDFPGGSVGVGPEGNGTVIPKALTLGQNYPNPFNPSTVIPFTIPEIDGSGNGIPVKLTVYDVRGRRIAVLIDRRLGAGDYRVNWNGRDQAGESVESGLFFYRLETPGFSATKRMVIVK
jgi:choice-of-anchor B domain-containing protein